MLLSFADLHTKKWSKKLNSLEQHSTKCSLFSCKPNKNENTKIFQMLKKYILNFDSFLSQEWKENMRFCRFFVDLHTKKWLKKSKVKKKCNVFEGSYADGIYKYKDNFDKKWQFAWTFAKVCV